MGYQVQYICPVSYTHLDIDEYELSRNIKEKEKKYQTDARDFMRMILNENIRDYSLWKQQCLEVKKILDKYDKQEGNLAVEKIASMLPEDPVVSVDVYKRQRRKNQTVPDAVYIYKRKRRTVNRLVRYHRCPGHVWV